MNGGTDIKRVRRHPQAGSTQSSTRRQPKSVSAVSSPPCRAAMRSVAPWVVVTGHAKASLVA